MYKLAQNIQKNDEKYTKIVCQTKDSIAMHLLSLPEDNICNILFNLDVVQFIFLLSTCKQLYQMRKEGLKFFKEGNNYSEYDSTSKFIAVFLSSYIDIPSYQTDCYGKYLLPGTKLQENKIKNTLSVIGYHCTQNTKLHKIYKTDDRLLVMCCRAVSKKFRYKYKEPYHRLHRLFWLNWHLCNVSVFDICELIYHIKNRKYRNVFNLLSSIKFRESTTDNSIETLNYLVTYIKCDNDNKYVATILCLMYMHIVHTKDSDQYTPHLKQTIIEKSEQHTEALNNVTEFPKYLKEFMAHQFTSVVTIL